jgi:hypothetical protein
MITLSSGGIKKLTFEQPTPSSTWAIAHNLGSEPAVETLVLHNASYKKAFPLSVSHTDPDNVIVTWSVPRSGLAVLIAAS